MEETKEKCEYPLNSSWVLWEHQKNTNNNYDQNTKLVYEFSSIENFWRLFNNYPYPSKYFYHNNCKPKFDNPLREVSSVSLFRKGVHPKWEDPLNTNGGEIAIKRFKNTDVLAEIDKCWKLLAVICVTENFDMSEEITGIRVVDSSIPGKKALYRIEIWFSNKDNRLLIEKSFKEKMNFGPFVQLHYKEHSTAVESTPRKKNYHSRSKSS